MDGYCLRGRFRSPATLQVVESAEVAWASVSDAPGPGMSHQEEGPRKPQDMLSTKTKSYWERTNSFVAQELFLQTSEKCNVLKQLFIVKAWSYTIPFSSN